MCNCFWCLLACRRYEAESAVRLGLPHEPSAAVTSAVEMCDEIAEALCGWADEECEGGQKPEDDILRYVVDEYNEEEPFEDLERALRLATRPFPDLKACTTYPFMPTRDPSFLIPSCSGDDKRKTNTWL